MKKTLCILLALTLLLLTVGCARDEKPDDQAKDPAKTSSTTASDISAEPSIETLAPYPPGTVLIAPCGETGLDRRFVEETYDMTTVYYCVGADAYHQWIDDVFTAIPMEERDVTPPLRQAIRYFNIKREDFVSVLEKCKQAYGTALDDAMVDALYADDVNTMLEALARPSAFYHDGTVYSINEMLTVLPQDCIDLGITTAHLGAYLEKLETDTLDNVYSDEALRGTHYYYIESLNHALGHSLGESH